MLKAPFSSIKWDKKNHLINNSIIVNAHNNFINFFHYFLIHKSKSTHKLIYFL
jgi:hypothetical protein